MDNQELKFITIKQASKILGVTALTLRNWDNNGKFKAWRHPINNYRVYKVADVEKLLSDITSNSERRLGKKEIRKLIVRHEE